MLDIVINSLYQNKDIFLRELISNASDALDKIRFMSLTKPEYLAVEEKMQVQIEFDPESNTLTIRDTGIGMTHDDMISNLGTVARSGTTRFMQALEQGGDAKSSGVISQIGQFGVGFYSAFLVSDRVQVASKHPDSDTQYIWTSANGASEFDIYPDPRGSTLTRGTEITLFLKEDCLEYAEQNKLAQLAKHYSEFVQHPIYLRTIETVTVEVEEDEDVEEKSEDDDDLEVSDEDDVEEEEKPKKTEEVTTFEYQHLNGSPAIWTRPKDEIEDEDYQNFYKIIVKDDELAAETWTHFQAEGNINFKSILYLPQEIPASWNSGMMEHETTGLSLYVQKVLISDTFDLLPRYLNFLKGVVDSDDLPLNVNRETLQESKIIQVIKKKVVRKALEMLKKFVKDADGEGSDFEDITDVDINDDGEIEYKTGKSKARRNKYNDWFSKFSPSIKMGAIEDEPNRGKIMKLIRFKSSKATDNMSWVGLEEYIENMKDWQDEIFFVAGIDQDAVEKSQFLEPFLAKGVEVLYFTDPIDEYMAQNVGSFEGKKFKNIATENVKFKDEEDTDLVARREKYYKTTFKPLTKYLKKLYGSSVMRVVISNRLVSAPAIASSAEFGHSANMERIMRAQAYSHGQNELAMKSMKIFELNARHPFVVKLLEGAPPEDQEGDEEFKVDPEVEDAAWILHEMALLNGGFPLSDPEAHTKRMMKFMQSQLGVKSLTLEPEPDLSVVEEEAPDIDFADDGPEGTSPEDAIPLTPDEIEEEAPDIDVEDDGPKGTSPEDAIPLTPDESGNIEL
jgi:heat shock protein beta